jgi:hypothetical protein
MEVLGWNESGSGLGQNGGLFKDGSEQACKA